MRSMTFGDVYDGVIVMAFDYERGVGAPYAFGQLYYGYEICIYLSSSSYLYLTVPCCLFNKWRRTHVLPDTVLSFEMDEAHICWRPYAI
jgi:hypothetical protein